VANHKEYPEIELHRSDTHENGTLTQKMYKVEVRSSYYDPTVVDNGFVIDFAWRTLPIVRGPSLYGMNVPVAYFDRDGVDHGLVSFTAAQAHRWAFHAWLEARQIAGSLCIQTRLVQVEFHRTHSIKEIGVSDSFGDAMNLRNGVQFNPRHDATTEKKAAEHE